MTGWRNALAATAVLAQGGCAISLQPCAEPCGAGGDGAVNAREASADAARDDGVATSPRQIAPLSGSIVTSQRPTFHWVGSYPSGRVVIDVCVDHGCDVVLFSAPVSGTSYAPAAALSRGSKFWRLRTEDGLSHGPTWEFTVGARTAAQDTSGGNLWDLDLDGLPDVVLGEPAGYETIPGRVAIYVGSDLITTAPTVTLTAPSGSAGCRFGWVVSSAGDVDGDGLIELVVGSPGCHDGDPGRAYVYKPDQRSISVALVATLGPAPGNEQGFGATMSFAGDLNGDGYGDFVVGTGALRSNTGVARVRVYFGSPSGLSETNVVDLTAPAEDHDDIHGFGETVVGLGDVNADGYGDIAVASPASIAGNGMTHAGRVYVYLGSADADRSLVPIAIDGPDGGDGMFGLGLSAAGDLDGDGYWDFIANGRAGTQTYVYRGGATGIRNEPSAMLTPPGPAGTILSSPMCPVGDVNGDGFADVLLGWVSTPTLVVFFGGLLGGEPFPAESVLVPGEIRDSIRYAQAAAGVGDLNRDGFDDVVATFISPDLTGARAYVLLGEQQGLSPMPYVILGSSQSGTQFGHSVALPVRPSRGVRPTLRDD